MAHSSRLVDWLLANADRLSLAAHKYTWPDHWLPGYHDYIVTILIDGVEVSGSGLGRSEDEAFLKAGAEALERYIYRFSGNPTTSGLAVHADDTAARDGACLELIERDAFFCHYLTGVPFGVLEFMDMNQLPFDFEALRNRASSYGADIVFGQMCTLTGAAAVAFGIVGIKAANQFGVRIGLGCKQGVASAFEHAVLEAFKRSIRLIEGQPTQRLTLKEFGVLARPTVADHDALGLDLAASEPTRKLFSNAHMPCVLGRSDVSDMNYRQVTLPKSIADAPLVAWVAESPGLQRAFFGRTHPGVVNLPRLQQFANRPLDFSALEPLPHVFG